MTEKQKPEILIIMGSDSDLPNIQSGLDYLKKLGVPFTARVCSAHKTPQLSAELASKAKEEGYRVIIAAAGMAAHLAGVFAAYTTLPVIALPIASGSLQGMDALLAMVQMPPGIPVATVGINASKNAAILALEILALGDPSIAEKLAAEKENLKKQIQEKDQKLQEKLGE